MIFLIVILELRIILQNIWREFVVNFLKCYLFFKCFPKFAFAYNISLTHYYLVDIFSNISPKAVVLAKSNNQIIFQILILFEVLCKPSKTPFSLQS